MRWNRTVSGDSDHPPSTIPQLTEDQGILQVLLNLLLASRRRHLEETASSISGISQIRAGCLPERHHLSEEYTSCCDGKTQHETPREASYKLHNLLSQGAAMTWSAFSTLFDADITHRREIYYDNHSNRNQPCTRCSGFHYSVRTDAEFKHRY